MEIPSLINMGLQRQLFWGVVALSSFIGYFQFLAVIGEAKRKWFSLFPLYEAIFGGFVFAQTLSITRIADLIRWVYELEQQGNIAVVPNFFEPIVNLFPLFTMLICGFLWFVFLGLFIEGRYKRI